VNRASIITDIQIHKERFFLSTGDAFDIEGKRDITEILGSNILPYHFMTVPHHGSPKNTDLEFFKKVKAKHYLISSGNNLKFNVLKNIIDSRVPGEEFYIIITGSPRNYTRKKLKEYCGQINNRRFQVHSLIQNDQHQKIQFKFEITKTEDNELEISSEVERLNTDYEDLLKCD